MCKHRFFFSSYVQKFINCTALSVTHEKWTLWCQTCRINWNSSRNLRQFCVGPRVTAAINWLIAHLTVIRCACFAHKHAILTWRKTDHSLCAELFFDVQSGETFFDVTSQEDMSGKTLSVSFCSDLSQLFTMYVSHKVQFLSTCTQAPKATWQFSTLCLFLCASIWLHTWSPMWILSWAAASWQQQDFSFLCLLIKISKRRKINWQEEQSLLFWNQLRLNASIDTVNFSNLCFLCVVCPSTSRFIPAGERILLNFNSAVLSAANDTPGNSSGGHF